MTCRPGSSSAVASRRAIQGRSPPPRRPWADTADHVRGGRVVRGSRPAGTAAERRAARRRGSASMISARSASRRSVNRSGEVISSAPPSSARTAGQGPGCSPQARTNLSTVPARGSAVPPVINDWAIAAPRPASAAGHSPPDHCRTATPAARPAAGWCGPAPDRSRPSAPPSAVRRRPESTSTPAAGTWPSKRNDPLSPHRLETERRPTRPCCHHPQAGRTPW